MGVTWILSVYGVVSWGVISAAPQEEHRCEDE
jgi:hypothetical protein